MSIAKKLMTVGAEKDVYVDDVFSTYLYEGNGVGQSIRNGIALGSAYGGNSTAFPTPEANDAIRKGDLLTGGQSSISCTFSAWVYVDPDCAEGGQSLHLLRLVGNKNGSSGYPWGGFLSFNLENNGSPDTWRFNILSYAADGTKLINLNQDYSNQEYRITPGQWTHLLVSFDMTNEAAFQFCKNDAVATKFAFNAFVLANLPTANYALVNEEYFGHTSSSNRLQGNLAHVYFDYTNRDLNVEANRRLFITADGQPAAGQASLSPIIYLPLTGGPVTNNEGTGGDFTEVDGGVEVVNGFGPANASSEGEGGMVWIKNRDAGRSHFINDTERGVERRLQSNSANAEYNTTNGGNSGLSAFTSNGFVLGGDTDANANDSTNEYVSWTFRKQKNFFDMVTYTGDGNGLTIPHNLGVEPGIIIIKNISESNRDWHVYHKSLGHTKSLTLNSTAAEASSSAIVSPPTDETFTLKGGQGATCGGAYEYVAYLFAHDDSDESMVKCGSYTGNGNSDGPEIDLGFEPQWVMIKSSTIAKDWNIFDAARGIVTGGADSILVANESSAESVSSNASNSHIEVLPNGFKLANNSSQTNDPGQTYIYMAIRRPNKPAEEFEPEELFAVDGLAPTSPPDPWFTSGFVTDMCLTTQPNSGGDRIIGSRLTGTARLQTNNTSAEITQSNQHWDYMNGAWDANSTDTYLAWMWRRAPGFFDVVCYDGEAIGDPVGYTRDIPHKLGVAPEMMWIKDRSRDHSWAIYSSSLTADEYLRFNAGGPVDDSGADEKSVFAGVHPTESVFTLGWSSLVNTAQNNNTYIACLFASVPGLSKVGSYTGTGVAGLDIDCGFTTGARFVLIKRTDAAESWNFWDTVRGITTGNDPKLSLDTSSPQYSSANYLNPLPSGFTVDTNGTDLNADGGEYLFYAIA